MKKYKVDLSLKQGIEIQEAVPCLKTLSINNGFQLACWIAAHGWKLYDNEWVKKQDWGGIDVFKIIILRIIFGSEVFDPIVCSSIAAYMDTKEDRFFVGILHLSDQKLAEMMDSLWLDIVKLPISNMIKTAVENSIPNWIALGYLTEVE